MAERPVTITPPMAERPVTITPPMAERPVTTKILATKTSLRIRASSDNFPQNQELQTDNIPYNEQLPKILQNENVTTTLHPEEMEHKKRELQERLKFLKEANRNLLGERLLFNRRQAENSEHIPQRHGMPMDCADHLVNGATKSGVYSIYPFTCLCSKPVKVWCDMETDGGGWTVLLNRDKKMKQENFNRNWNDYRDGFGNVIGEFWLGNEMLSTLTQNRNYRLRMDVFSHATGRRVGHWSSVTVESETRKYQLKLGSYLSESTTQGNCLAHSNKRFFSTFDRDHDGAKRNNCAQGNKGGWWYNLCDSNPIPTAPFGKGRFGSNCFIKGRTEPVWMQLKIRPTICSAYLKTALFNSNGCGSCN
ncbi:ficolin-1-like 6 [Homarus americanus]|uniref:Ficolin-1-like 6 n=1 Tax=Homarus americanus TaxID=6706 RepID=A0A8J5JJJ4_HOMAM|nr:ficolin-1-like 6 [Homarus americanus]